MSSCRFALTTCHLLIGIDIRVSESKFTEDFWSQISMGSQHKV